MQINLNLKTGTDKNGKPWFMVQTVAGKYSGEPVFISELEYDYLQRELPQQNQPKPVPGRVAVG